MASSQDQIEAAALPATPAKGTGGDPLVGRTIGGNFRVIKLIGAGAMGNVYQAEQKSLGKMVAIKLLHRELMVDEKLIKRFELEAKNASSLNHPNSIQIIDFGRDGDLLYIAMELLPGRDLAHVITQESPLPPSRIVRIMDQVLAALDEAHATTIIHRDLKPSNIMLVSRRGETDSVKVCDFGIAKCQGARDQGASMLTMKGLVCGTPEYMSPEQARGEEVDGRSDLYSAAVILYQMVTGDLPFTASSPVGILSKHLVERPQAPSARKPGLVIPAALESLILRGLEKNPADRPQSATAFRQELRAALSPSQITPAPLMMPLAAQATMPYPIRGVTAPAVAAKLPGSTVKTTSPARSRWLVPVLAVVVLGAVAVVMALPSARRDVVVPPGSAATVTARLAPIPTVNQPDPLAPRKAPEPAPASDGTAAAAPTEPAAPSAGSEPTAPGAAAARERGRRNKRDKGKPTGTAATRLALVTPDAPAQTVLDKPASATAPRPETTAQAVLAPPTATATQSAAVKDPIAASGKDLLLEAEKLLGQGDSGAACAKGEDAKRQGPKAPAVYKFLGKCYNRAGNAQRANENYRRYLELAPDASDGAFIRSIVK